MTDLPEGDALEPDLPAEDPDTALPSRLAVGRDPEVPEADALEQAQDIFSEDDRSR